MDFLRSIRARHTLLWAALDQVVLSGGAFLVVFVLSRFLPYEAFGGIRFLAAVLAISAFFSLPGVSYVFMQDGERLAARDALRMLKTQMRWGAGATAAGVAFWAYYLHVGEVDLARGFLISGLFAPFANLYLTPGFLLASQKRFRDKALVDGVTMVLIALGAGYGAWMAHSIAGTAFYYFGLQTAGTALMLWIVVRSLPKDAPPRHGHPSDEIRYGTQLTLLQLPFTLLPSFEKVVVFFLLGPANLAFFIVAALPAEHAKNALRSLFQFYIFPHMKRGVQGSFSQWMRLATTLVALAMLASALFVVFVFPFVFPRYVSMYPFALALTLALAPLPAQILTLSWIASRHLEKLRAFAYALTVADVALFVALSAWGGLPGAVAAKIVLEFVGAALVAFLHFSRGV